jgi:hypothetical protein
MPSTTKERKGKQGGRRKERKEGREGGRKEGRKERRKEGRKEDDLETQFLSLSLSLVCVGLTLWFHLEQDGGSYSRSCILSASMLKAQCFHENLIISHWLRVNQVLSRNNCSDVD